MKHSKIIEDMPNEKSKILKYNHGQKFMKFPFVTYGSSESLLKKLGVCYNNPEISSATKINEYTLFHYSLFAKCSFDPTKNMLNYYREKIFMIRFCKDLKEHINYKIIKNYEKIINYEKKRNHTIASGRDQTINQSRSFLYMQKSI